jgi:hypothetical protein
MRFFASWWERVPVRRIGAVVAVVAVVGLVTIQVGVSSRATAPHFSNIHAQLPQGEVWD